MYYVIFSKSMGLKITIIVKDAFRMKINVKGHMLFNAVEKKIILLSYMKSPKWTISPLFQYGKLN